MEHEDRIELSMDDKELAFKAKALKRKGYRYLSHDDSKAYYVRRKNPLFDFSVSHIAILMIFMLFSAISMIVIVVMG